MQEEGPIQIQTKNTMEGGEGEQEDIQEEREWFTDDDPRDRESSEQDDPAQLDVPSYEYDTEEHPEGRSTDCQSFLIKILGILLPNKMKILYI